MCAYIGTIIVHSLNTLLGMGKETTHKINVSEIHQDFGVKVMSSLYLIFGVLKAVSI
jgi:hypothetical protein